MTIKVFTYTQRIVVDPADNSVTIVNAGPQGPAGASGSGVPTGGETYEILSKLSNSDGDVDWISYPLVDNTGAPVQGIVSATEPVSPSVGTVWIDTA